MYLMREARRRGLSGVGLKDDSGHTALAQPQPQPIQQLSSDDTL
jgi:hypothetical protein